jgi:hypothetical protein
MNDNRLFQLRPLDWRWLVLTYCFFILFHLFLSFIVVWGGRTNTEIFLRTDTVMWPTLAWMVVGIFLVASYVGFRSISITVLEPGLAAVFYLATLFLSMKNVGQADTVRHLIILTLWVVLMHLLAFLIGCGGAAFGEWLQMRKEKKQMA